MSRCFELNGLGVFAIVIFVQTRNKKFAEFNETFEYNVVMKCLVKTFNINNNNITLYFEIIITLRILQPIYWHVASSK